MSPSAETTKSTLQEEQITAENYAFLQAQIYRDSGIVLDDSKHYLIEARLLPIAQKANLRTLNELCVKLRSPDSTALRRRVVEAMTTNETFFFRDVPVFDTIRDKIFPALVEKRQSSRTLNVWSAASSTGQEAYSLAILLLEMGLAGWKIRILGTDLNTEVVEQARSGRYTHIEVNRGLPARYLVKYFGRVGSEWQAKDELRRIVDFQPFDLRQSFRNLGPFDLILCRNVLIYFDVKTKKQILGEMFRALNPQGLLLLGSAETTHNLEDRFQRRLFGASVFYETPEK